MRAVLFKKTSNDPFNYKLFVQLAVELPISRINFSKNAQFEFGKATFSNKVELETEDVRTLSDLILKSAKSKKENDEGNKRLEKQFSTKKLLFKLMRDLKICSFRTRLFVSGFLYLLLGRKFMRHR